MHPARKFRPLGIARRQMADRGEYLAGMIARGEGIQDLMDARDCCRNASSLDGKRFRHQTPLSVDPPLVRSRYHAAYCGARRKMHGFYAERTQSTGVQR